MRHFSRFVVAVLGLWTGLAFAQQSAFVVVFNATVAEGDADAVLSTAGLARIEHPDLLANQRIVRATAAEIEKLTKDARVITTFPASESLATGAPVHGCESVVPQSSKGSPYAASMGSGWGREATLTWSISKYPEGMTPEVVDAILERALSEWARHGAVRFTRTNQLRGRRNVEFVFASGQHGDPYPFPPNHSQLAHAFYPASINPEPVAGDVHLNSDEPWGTGGDRDLYSAVLHEVGHALGLTHSVRPGTVMYPYYHELTSLAGEDMEELQELYGPPAEAPLSLAISGETSTAAPFAELKGTVSGGAGQVVVTWSANGGQGSAAGGRLWTASVPLVMGNNEVKVSAMDAEGRVALQTYSVVRREAAVSNTPMVPAPVPAPTTTSADRVAPALSIASPAAAVSSTSSAAIRISGTARDNTEVTEVTWDTGRASGTAQGTRAWAAEVPLLLGDNSIVIRARDAAGNVGWRSLLVVRR